MKACTVLADHYNKTTIIAVTRLNKTFGPFCALVQWWPAFFHYRGTKAQGGTINLHRCPVDVAQLFFKKIKEASARLSETIAPLVIGVI